MRTKAARSPRTLHAMFCIALPARVVVRMQTQEFECHIRPRTYLHAYFECDIVRVNVAIVYGDDSFVASV